MPKRRANIEIDTEALGLISMRSFLKMDDFEKLGIATGIVPRDFTVKFLAEIVQMPNLGAADLLGVGDTALQQIAGGWITETNSAFRDLLGGVSAFDIIQQDYSTQFSKMFGGVASILSEAYAPAFPAIHMPIENLLGTNMGIAGIDSLLASTQSSLGAMAESVVGSLGSNFSLIQDMFPAPLQTGIFFENLPDIRELTQHFEKVEQAVAELDDDGYFLLDHWSLSNLLQFVGIDQVDLRVRSAVVTNKLLGITRHQDFFNEAKLRFSNSSVLNRRWRVIEQALVAHRNRHYAISIPTLLAQIEGIFTDALVLKGAVNQDNGKLYARDQTGATKLGRDGKPVQLHGLGQKVQNSDLQNEALLQDLARFFTDYLVKGRNDIMHGRIVDYDKAKLSVQLLLYTYLLAAEFVDFESES